MNPSDIIAESVKYIADHLQIKLEQVGNNQLKAKLILKTFR